MEVVTARPPRTVDETTPDLLLLQPNPSSSRASALHYSLAQSSALELLSVSPSTPCNATVRSNSLRLAHLRELRSSSSMPNLSDLLSKATPYKAALFPTMLNHHPPIIITTFKPDQLWQLEHSHSSSAPHCHKLPSWPLATTPLWLMSQTLSITTMFFESQTPTYAKCPCTTRILLPSPLKQRQQQNPRSL
jgi:hypothetical protein